MTTTFKLGPSALGLHRRDSRYVFSCRTRRDFPEDGYPETVMRAISRCRFTAVGVQGKSRTPQSLKTSLGSRAVDSGTSPKS